MRKKLILKDKRKFICFIACILTLMLIIISIADTYGYKKERYEIIKVNSGDTLWDIALCYYKKGDIREYIHNIMEINNLEDSEIKAGTELTIIVE